MYLRTAILMSLLEPDLFIEFLAPLGVHFYTSRCSLSVFGLFSADSVSLQEYYAPMLVKDAFDLRHIATPAPLPFRGRLSAIHSIDRDMYIGVGKADVVEVGRIDSPTVSRMMLFRQGREVHCSAFSNNLLFVGLTEGRCAFIQPTPTPTPVSRPSVHSGNAPVRCAAHLRDDHWISAARRVVVHTPTRPSYAVNTLNVRAVQIYAASDHVAVVSTADGAVVVWDSRSKPYWRSESQGGGNIFSRADLTLLRTSTPNLLGPVDRAVTRLRPQSQLRECPVISAACDDMISIVDVRAPAETIHKWQIPNLQPRSGHFVEWKTGNFHGMAIQSNKLCALTNGDHHETNMPVSELCPLGLGHAVVRVGDSAMVTDGASFTRLAQECDGLYGVAGVCRVGGRVGGRVGLWGVDRAVDEGCYTRDERLPRVL